MRTSVSPAIKVTVAGLAVASAGFVLQMLGGRDFPPIPPGLVILIAATAAAAFVPWRWAPLAGTLVGLALLIGLVASGSVGMLFDPSLPVALIGLWIQNLALIVVVVASIVAVRGTNQRSES